MLSHKLMLMANGKNGGVCSCIVTKYFGMHNYKIKKDIIVKNTASPH